MSLIIRFHITKIRLKDQRKLIKRSFKLKYNKIKDYLVVLEFVYDNIFHEYYDIKVSCTQMLEELDWYREFHKDSRVLVNAG